MMRVSGLALSSNSKEELLIQLRVKQMGERFNVTSCSQPAKHSNQTARQMERFRPSQGLLGRAFNLKARAQFG